MSRLSKILLFMSGISFVSFVIVRFLLGSWVPFLWVALGLFAFFLVSALWVDRKFFGEFFSMKTTKQGLSMGSMILMVLTVLAVVNYFGARKYKTWDLSANQVNTLSDQSIKMIEGLKGDLKVMYFYKDGTEGVEQNRRAFMDLIKKYQDKSNFVKLEFLEINQSPEEAEKYQIKKATQSVILEYQGRTAQIEKIDEQELTGGLVKVTREKDKVIYVLSGHGELGFEATQDGESISFLKQLLEGNRYTVKSFSFSDASVVPKDADVLMILGPEQQFLELEIQALENYLKSGGNLFLALEPKAKHGLESFASKLGLKLGNNYILTVMDTPLGRAMDPRFTRGNIFSPVSTITKPFSKSEFTVFRTPQALLREGSAPPFGLSIDDLVRSGENSMAFQSMQFDKSSGSGPFTLVASVKGKFPGSSEAPEFNMILAGDRHFLNDASLYQNLNRDLVLNAVSALAKEENLISITPKEVARTQITLLSSQFAMFVISFVALTLALYIWGGVLWWRRRYS